MAQVEESTAETRPLGSDTDQQGPDKPGKKPRKPSTLPPVNKIVNDSSFFEYVAALDKDQDWPRVAIYGYRHYPRIIRDPSNILKIDGEPPSEPLNKDFILKEFGSGKYNLKLNDKTNGFTIVQTNLDYNYPDHPPIFDLRELDTGASGNRLLVEKLIREGKLTQDRQVVTPADPGAENTGLAQALKEIALKAMENKGGQQQQGTQDLAYQKSLGMIADASAESLKVVMDRLKTEGKSSELGTIMPLLLALIGQRNTPPPADNGVMTILTQMLTASEKRAEQAEERARQDRIDAEKDRQRQHELQLESLKTRADPMDMIDKVLGIKERLSGDDEPKAKRPGWPGLIEDNMDQLIDLGKAAIGVLGTRSSYRPTPQPQPGNQPATSAAPESAARPQPQGELIEMPQAAISSDPEICFLYPIFLAKGGDLVNFFKSDPTSGPLVADLVRTMGGAATYERIAQMGVDRILATIKLIPQMEADFAAAGSADMLRTFIEDFVGGDEDDEDEEPVIPEAGKPAKQKKSKQGAPIA